MPQPLLIHATPYNGGMTNDEYVLLWIADDFDTFKARVIDRFIERDGHLIWTGSKNTLGYGYVGIPYKYVKRKSVPVHRAMHLWRHGLLPVGSAVDHDASGCRTRLCAKDDHLTVERTALPGSVYEGACRKCGSTEWKIETNGRRRCYPCRRRQMRAYNARQAGQ
jgi:hypothetical protein